HRLAPEPVDPAVAGDGEDPGAGGSLARSVACGLVPDREHRLLYQILGRLFAHALLQHEALDARTAMAEQARKRRAVTPFGHPPDETGEFRLRDGALPLGCRPVRQCCRSSGNSLAATDTRKSICRITATAPASPPLAKPGANSTPDRRRAEALFADSRIAG